VCTITNITEQELHFIQKYLSVRDTKDDKSKDSENLSSWIKREASERQENMMMKPPMI
jgi:hypothetical protein